MGFCVEPTHYRLKFTDPKLEGLEVTVESVDIGTMVNLMSMADLGEVVDAKNASNVTGAMTQMFDMFAEKLVSWNLEDKQKQPIPATKEGVYKQEPGFVMMLIMNWIGAISSVDNPLLTGSNSGETSQMPLLTMEPL